MARISNVPSSLSDSSATSPTPTAHDRFTRVRARVQPEELSDESDAKSLPDDQSLHPDGYRSLSFISVQAFVLGNVLSACLFSTIWLVEYGHPIWRAPAFLIFLSLFHFLEFYMTARFNAPAARASSFLLFNNGRAYAFAHTMATVEIVLSNFLLPQYQAFLYSWVNVLVGLGLIVIGQIFRSFAMAQAGTNFNHIIAQERKESHVLITDGIYSIVRHPSYFGFFWWAIGTQILVGNKLSLLGYIVVLWKFFSSRIREERFLVQFFEEKYVAFRKRTSTGIPFIP